MFERWGYRKLVIGRFGITQKQTAKTNGYVIVSQDVDFAEMATLLGLPPKVIWLRAGNQSTAVISRLLQHHAEAIVEFWGDDGTACLEIY